MKAGRAAVRAGGGGSATARL